MCSAMDTSTPQSSYVERFQRLTRFSHVAMWYRSTAMTLMVDASPLEISDCTKHDGPNALRRPTGLLSFAIHTRFRVRSPRRIDLSTESHLCGEVLPRRLGDRPVGALIVGPDGESTDLVWRIVCRCSCKHHWATESAGN